GRRRRRRRRRRLGRLDLDRFGLGRVDFHRLRLGRRRRLRLGRIHLGDGGRIGLLVVVAAAAEQNVAPDQDHHGGRDRDIERHAVGALLRLDGAEVGGGVVGDGGRRGLGLIGGGGGFGFRSGGRGGRRSRGLGGGGGLALRVRQRVPLLLGGRALQPVLDLLVRRPAGIRAERDALHLGDA